MDKPQKESRIDDLLDLMELIAQLKDLQEQFDFTKDRRLFAPMRDARAAIAAKNAQLGLAF